MVRRRKERCTIGVELGPGRPAAREDSDARAVSGEFEDAGCAELVEDEDSSVLTVRNAEKVAGDRCCGVEGAVGGGELGGDESCMSTSATSCASLVLVEINAAADVDVASVGSASVMTTSCSEVTGLRCSVSSLVASELDTANWDAFIVADGSELELVGDAAKSEANSPTAMMRQAELKVAVRASRPMYAE